METPTEVYLARVVPGLEQSWSGASEDEIAEIEAIAGRPLPGFYRWFLEKMGRSIGRLAEGRWDLSATRILARYRTGVVGLQSRYLFIGEEPDQIMPMHLFYDLDRPIRDDAMVVSRPAAGGAIQPDYETFREMMTTYAARRFTVAECPHGCRGGFTASGDEPVLDLVATALAGLGFSTPVVAGAYSAIFERAAMSVVCRIHPEPATKGALIFFEMGGPTTAELRGVLGDIAHSTGITVDIHEWTPPLP